MYRSEHILKGLSNQYYRATYKSMGFTTDDLKRPIIGIANAWRSSVPRRTGHRSGRQRPPRPDFRCRDRRKGRGSPCLPKISPLQYKMV